MIVFRLRLILLGSVLALALPACGGGGQQGGDSLGLRASEASVAASRHYHVTGSGHVTGDLAVRASTALPGSSIRFHGLHNHSLQPCPTIPPIDVENPFPFPITIRIESFKLYVRCAISGQLFGASWSQTNPTPAVVSPLKIGDATASGSVITFAASLRSITLAPRTTYQLLILAETSTSAVAFPVIPSSTTNITANAPSITSGSTFNGLTFTYSTSSGASAYSAACFQAFVNGQLAPFLQNVPIVGTPAFYCQISTPNNAPITFGQTVNFNVLAPPPDRAFFEPDGAPQGFACSEPVNNASSCNVPQFSIPTTYQNFIVGNVQDLRLCVPAKENTDCNSFGTDPQGGTLSTVNCCREFQLLVADDPTYKPPTSATPTQPWDGLFRMSYSPGICEASPYPDNDNGDGPPGYSDSGQKGIGPAAEFDVKPLASGTCTITVTEDSRYIIDDSNPSAPKPRSATISVTVKGGWW